METTKIPTRIKFSYALVNFTAELLATVWALFALHYMTNNAKLEPSLAGWVAGIYRIWDALNDPLVGNWSDNTKNSYWGKRRLWMLMGVFPYGISYFLMWWIPFQPTQQTALFIYFLTIKFVSDFGYTCVNVPHLALLNDMTNDYHERFQINSMRTICSAVGSLTSMILVAVFSKLIPDEEKKFLTLAAVTATLECLAVSNAVYQTRQYKGMERPKPKHQLNIFQRFKIIFSVKASALAVSIYVLAMSCLQGTLAIITYFIKDYIRFDDKKLVLVILTGQVVGISCAGIVLAIQKKVEKRLIYGIGASAWLLFYIGVPLVTPKYSWALYPLACIMGIGIATAMMVPIGYVSDAAEVIDYEKKERVEGTLFGSLHLFNKALVAAIVFVFEQVLEGTGFDVNNSSDSLSKGSILAMRVCLSVIPASLLVLTLFMNYLMPINKKYMEMVAQELKARRAENADDSMRLKEIEQIEETKPPYLTYFLIDGLDRHVFKNLMSRGELPNIAEIIKHGGWVKNGVTAFPSMTGYAFYAFLTGEDSAKSGIMGLRWFNRDQTKGKPGIRNYVGKTNHFMNKDFSGHAPTIFEKFSNNHSFSIQSYANRGVKMELKLGWPLVTAKFKESKLVKFLSYVPRVKSTLHDWFSYEDLVIDKTIDDLLKKPKVQWITFGSTDSCSHLEGASKTYIETVKHVDKVIGKYITACKRMGLHENRIYCILSDHGQTDIKFNLDIGKNLGEKTGLRYKNSSDSAVLSDQLDDSHQKYKKLDLIACVNGNSGVYLYFRDPAMIGEAGWSYPLSVNTLKQYPTPIGKLNMIHEVLSIEGVALAFTRGTESNSCEIHSPDGSSKVTFDDITSTYQYEITHGDDPLQYDTKLHNARYTAEKWLELTYDSDFPHGVVRGYNMMQAEASGDIMVIAKPEYDFGKDCEPIVKNYKGGHGGLCKDHMLVPFIISGPGVKPGSTVETATAEDLGATLFNLMGVKSNGNGKVIAPLLLDENSKFEN